jgi:NMD protein affecting ribosome stability and mRNA decay
MRERSKYMLCSDCGFAVPTETMFIKEYKNTAICLCRKCAKDLSKEIQQHYKVEVVRCKDCVLKYKSNDGETYCYRHGMPIDPNGYCNFGTRGYAE